MKKQLGQENTIRMQNVVINIEINTNPTMFDKIQVFLSNALSFVVSKVVNWFSK